MSERILVVDDDQKILAMMRRGLIFAGYEVELAESGEQALDKSLDAVPDLVVLDVMLPGIDGLEVCRRLRAAEPKLPILLLTARDRVPDRVAGLDAGADDYLVKPFAFEELCARVRALARRAGGAAAAPATACGDLRLDDAGGATVAGEAVRLSPTERSLLECLLRRQGAAVRRAEIFLEVFGYDFDPGTNVIDVHIAHLRRKLSSSTAAIQTVRGIGYRLVAA